MPIEIIGTEHRLFASTGVAPVVEQLEVGKLAQNRSEDLLGILTNKDADIDDRFDAALALRLFCL